MLQSVTAPMGLRLNLPVTHYRSLPVPSIPDARLGVCFIKVTDLPEALDTFMEINPRVPSRSKKGLLAGPVIKGILDTLRQSPEEMALKNQGIYLLVEHAEFDNSPNSPVLQLVLRDVARHGIINGGHTYAAIREAVSTATDEERVELQNAYVQLHILQNIDEDLVPEIAEGLNRSRQVDDPSLANLQGEFDTIRKALKGTPSEYNIAYHQGDAGDVYISEILVYLELFNIQRFDDNKHPNSLYNRQALGLKYFAEDMSANRALMRSLIRKLPDFLWLADAIRKATPEAAKHNGFKYGMIKLSTGRAGSVAAKGTALPFSKEKTNYRVPNGWVYPMLSAFRANLELDEGELQWKLPIGKLLPKVIDSLVGVCISEHKHNNLRPELIGKRESAYAQCYNKVELYLAKQGLLQ